MLIIVNITDLEASALSSFPWTVRLASLVDRLRRRSATTQLNLGLDRRGFVRPCPSPSPISRSETASTTAHRLARTLDPASASSTMSSAVRWPAPTDETRTTTCSCRTRKRAVHFFFFRCRPTQTRCGAACAARRCSLLLLLL